MTDRGFARAASLLPGTVSALLERVPEAVAAEVQEIRLRAGAPVTLSTPSSEWRLDAAGTPVRGGQASGSRLSCLTAAQLEECFLKLCDYSVHAHQEELRHGYVTARGGCRVGVAGTAVVEDGRIASVRSITSLCLRVARRHDGCAAALAAAVLPVGRAPRSTLVCGEPSSGKSSQLRDLARLLASGSRPQRIAVVDERGELAGAVELNGCDTLCNSDTLCNCDVLRGYPKARGIQQAVRCLAPDLLIFDELGTADEVTAVLEGLNAGVAAVATAHCPAGDTPAASMAALWRRPQLRLALTAGAFEQVVFLQGRRSPGRLAHIMETGDWLAEVGGIDSDRADRRGRGAVCLGGAGAPEEMPRMRDSAG